MDYNDLRHFADSWGLIALGVMFIVAVGAAMRPSAKRHHDEAQMIPLRDEEADE